MFLLFDAMTWLIGNASGSKSQMSIGFVFSILQKSYVYVSQLENLTKFLWNPLPSTYFLFIITTLLAKAFYVPTWQGRATQTQTNMSWRHGVWNDGVFLRERRPSCIYILLCGLGFVRLHPDSENKWQTRPYRNKSQLNCFQVWSRTPPETNEIINVQRLLISSLIDDFSPRFWLWKGVTVHSQQ